MTYKNKKRHLLLFCFGLMACLGLPKAVGYAQGSAAQASPTGQANAVSVTKDQPTITIGGRDVMAVVKEIKAKEKFPVPESLTDSMSRHYIRARQTFNPYRHAPQRWNKDAPITVIELSDLGCLECMPTLVKVDKELADMAEDINYLHVYAPTPTASAVQLAGFYGKLAQKNDKFWVYRSKLQILTEADVNTYFNILAHMGLNHTAIRQSARRDSRRFYREMDADSQLLYRKKLKSSPAWLVNGILVASDHAIPIEKIKDLVRYEQARLNYEEELKQNNP